MRPYLGTTTRARASAMRSLVTSILMGVSICLSPSPSYGQSANVLTYHGGLFRTGVYSNETVLSPANVNSKNFGKLFACKVDGFLYAQPLYMADVNVPGKGIHNVVFAATEHNSVYAFDADSNLGENAQPLWKTALTDSSKGTSSVLISDLGLSDYPATELGINGTPVIDPDSGTLYVVAKVKDVSSGSKVYYERFFALDIGTGQPKFGSPVDIVGTYPGRGSGSDGNGHVIFDPLYDFQRSGLLLLNGIVYIACASQGDLGPYHGWLFGYDAHTLQQVQVYNATPNGGLGGIWMAGGAPAADSDGNIYFATGNGSFDVNQGGNDYGDSIIKLSAGPSGLQVSDYFCPADQLTLQQYDGDLGSGGVILFPDEAGNTAHPHLCTVIGKDETFYLVDRDKMGKYNATDNSQIVQATPLISPSFSTPAYFKNRIYYFGMKDFPKAFSITNAYINPTPLSQATAMIGFPGAVPCISADGTDGGIVWAIQADGFSFNGPAILHAYDAEDLSQELYNSAESGSRDQVPVGMKFSAPIVANGKVYIGTGGEVDVFGLLQGTGVPAPRLDINASSQLTVSGQAGATYAIQSTSDLGLGDAGWTTIATVTLSSASQTVADPNGPASDQRFYRALVQPLVADQ